MKKFNIPRTNVFPVNNHPMASMFIEFVRANNYPEMHTDMLIFEGAPDTALCSTMSDSATIDWVEAGMPHADKNEHLYRFDGGWVLQKDRLFLAYVDEHLYFFDF